MILAVLQVTDEKCSLKDCRSKQVVRREGDQIQNFSVWNILSNSSSSGDAFQNSAHLNGGPGSATGSGDASCIQRPCDLLVAGWARFQYFPNDRNQIFISLGGRGRASGGAGRVSFLGNNCHLVYASPKAAQLHAAGLGSGDG
jgi:hypothetical protein